MTDIDTDLPQNDFLYNLLLRRVQRAEQTPDPIDEVLGQVESAGKNLGEYRTARELARQKLSGQAIAQAQIMQPFLRLNLTEEEAIREAERKSERDRAMSGYRTSEAERKSGLKREEMELSHKLRMDRDTARGFQRKGSGQGGVVIPGMKQSHANAVVSQAKSVMDGIAAKLRAERNLTEAQVISQATDSTRAWVQQTLPKVKPEVIERVVQVARGGGPSVESELGYERGALGIEEAERKRTEGIRGKLKGLALSATSKAGALSAIQDYLDQIGESEDTWDELYNSDEGVRKYVGSLR